MLSNPLRMASETDDGDDSIADILAASDELSRVIDRYKFAVLRGRTTDSSAKRDTASSNAIPAISKATISRPLQRKNSEELLDLGGGGGHAGEQLCRRDGNNAAASKGRYNAREVAAVGGRG